MVWGSPSADSKVGERRLGLGLAPLKLLAGLGGPFTLGEWGTKRVARESLARGRVGWRNARARPAGSPGAFEGRTVARQPAERAEMGLVFRGADAARLEASSATVRPGPLTRCPTPIPPFRPETRSGGPAGEHTGRVGVLRGAEEGSPVSGAASTSGLSGLFPCLQSGVVPPPRG